jgi:hypothetical protein
MSLDGIGAETRCTCFFSLCVASEMQMAKGIGAALGGGLAGITKSLDDIGAELDAEAVESGVEPGEKKSFFEDRRAKMEEAMERYVQDSPHESLICPPKSLIACAPVHRTCNPRAIIHFLPALLEDCTPCWL